LVVANFDVAQTDRLLTTTRAVRKRLDLGRPVEPSIIVDCLRVAGQAPTGSNAQRWRWMVVTDPDKKLTIAGYYAKSFAAYMAPQLARLDPEDHARTKIVDSASYLADHLGEVPVIVIPCVLDRPPPGPGDAPAGFWGGILPAVWSFQLALRSRGLGSAWTTLHLNYEREVGDLLGVPDTVTQVALLPVAYFTGEDFRPAPRRPIEEVTYWDSWKSTTPNGGRT
jgi:nitroreductase